MPIQQLNLMYPSTRFEMVNRCLISIGETPLPSELILEQAQIGTDIDIAVRTVDETMVEVQSRGWYFNTDYSFPLLPNSEGFITLAPNALRVDFGNTEFADRYIQRNQGIYDLRHQTYKINRKLFADIIWLVDWEYLPPEAYEYIATRSSRKFQGRTIGANEPATQLVKEEADALANLERRQLQVQDYTLANPKVTTRVHNGYLKSGMYRADARRYI